MKKRFEIYLDAEELQLIELLKKDTIKRLVAESTQLKNKLRKYE